MPPVSTTEVKAALEKEIDGLRNAIRRLEDANAQTLQLLSQVRESTDLHKRHLESIDLRMEKFMVPAENAGPSYLI